MSEREGSDRERRLCQACRVNEVENEAQYCDECYAWLNEYAEENRQLNTESDDHSKLDDD